LRQTEWLVEPPRLPGTYMLERELSNAYNSVVLDGEIVRTAINRAIRRTNREKIRKFEEFGFMREGLMIEEYSVPPLMPSDVLLKLDTMEQSALRERSE